MKIVIVGCFLELQLTMLRALRKMKPEMECQCVQLDWPQSAPGPKKPPKIPYPCDEYQKQYPNAKYLHGIVTNAQLRSNEHESVVY